MKIMENMNAEDRYPAAHSTLQSVLRTLPGAKNLRMIAVHFLASDTIHITAVAEYITNYNAFWSCADSHNPNAYKGSPLG